MDEKNQISRTPMHLSFCQQADEILQRYSAKNVVTYMRNSGQDDKLTFQNIDTFIHEAKKEFSRIGLVRGDRAAILSPHSPWAVFMGIALAYSGITMALIDASLPQAEIESLLDYSDVKAVFTTEVLYRRFNPNILCKLPFFNLDESLKIIPFNKEQGDCLKLPASKDADEDVTAILYSSGTTGQMKGIMVTYKSVLKAREVFVRLSGLKDYMTYMLVLPFNHIAGFTGAMTFFLTGCEIGFIEDVNPSKLQNGLLKFQPYYFAMVPKVYEIMEQKIRAAIRAKGQTVESYINVLFKVSKFFRKYLGINIGRKMFHNITAQVFGENIFGIGTGASPCKAETAEFFLNLGLEWANLYATTETSVPIVATGILDRYPVGTVGNVNHHPEIQVKIGRPDQNGIGEIMVKSQLMMKGYFKRPDLTAEAFEDDFFKTGDYGYIDRKGYLHITGRIKESIVLGNGKKVSPPDVDEYYSARHPEYTLACRGIPVQEGLEDEIHLFVEEPGKNPELREQMRRALEKTSRNAEAMYQVRGIHFIDKIPLTSIGKVKRYLLQAPELPKADLHPAADSQLTSTTTPEAQIKQMIPAPGRTGNLTDNEELPNMIRSVMQDGGSSLQISPEMELKTDIGMDSLSIFELCTVLNDKFGISLEEKLHSHITVGEIQALIQGVNTTADSDGNSTVDISQFPVRRSRRLDRRLKRWIRLSRFIYRFEVFGLENIPQNFNFILCANHASYFDPIWILAAMGHTQFSCAKLACLAAIHTLHQNRRFFDMLGAVPVEREGNTAPAIKRIRECLNDGYMVILFPEGARSRDGTMLPFKNGAAMLAIDTGKPILPVRIEGAFEIFPRHHKYPAIWDWQHRRRFRLNIRFGHPIAPQGYTVQELTDKLRQNIEEM